MPRKYTRRVDPTAQALRDAIALPGGPPAETPAPAPYAPHLTALEQYGLWLKANQHVTNPIIPEPPKPRKPIK